MPVFSEAQRAESARVLGEVRALGLSEGELRELEQYLGYRSKEGFRKTLAEGRPTSRERLAKLRRYLRSGIPEGWRGEEEDAEEPVVVAWDGERALTLGWYAEVAVRLAALRAVLEGLGDVPEGWRPEVLEALRVQLVEMG